MPGEDIFHSPEKKNTLSPEMFKNIIKQRKDRRPISWNSAIKKLRQIACNVYNVSSWKRVRKCPDLINAPFGPLIKKLYRTQPVQRLRGALESFMRHRVRSITRADVPPAPPPQKKRISTEKQGCSLVNGLSKKIDGSLEYKTIPPFDNPNVMVTAALHLTMSTMPMWSLGGWSFFEFMIYFEVSSR